MISPIAYSEIDDIIYLSAREIDMTKNLKFRSGQFKVFHVGKMAYTVEHNDQVLAQFSSLGQAAAYAMRQSA